MTTDFKQPEGSQMDLSEACLAQGIEARYGSQEKPVSIELARQAIRADFVKFWQLVTEQCQMPKGHEYRTNWGAGPDYELNWFGGCEIGSTNSGASIRAGLAVPDPMDTTQLCIEVRYFHPATHYKDGRKKQKASRKYSTGYSAHLWIEQGRPYAGMYKSLIKGHEFCRDVDSAEELASIVVQRLKDAMARREPTHFDVIKNNDSTCL
jgi:hypothetical protein